MSHYIVKWVFFPRALFVLYFLTTLDDFWAVISVAAVN